MNDKELLVLNTLRTRYLPGTRNVISFSSLAFETQLGREELDHALEHLEREHYITQYVLESSDSFIVVVST